MKFASALVAVAILGMAHSAQANCEKRVLVSAMHVAKAMAAVDERAQGQPPVLITKDVEAAKYRRIYSFHFRAGRMNIQMSSIAADYNQGVICSISNILTSYSL